MRKELVYMRMPKAASGSVTWALKNKKATIISHGLYDPNYLSLAEYMKVDPHDKFAFTFVRNPWDRLVSAFFFLNRGGSVPNDKNDFEKYLEKYEGDFSLFVKEAFKTDEIFEQIHIRPQFQWICDKNGKLITDYVGKYETLQPDFNYVLKKNWRLKKNWDSRRKGATLITKNYTHLKPRISWLRLIKRILSYLTMNFKIDSITPPITLEKK